MKTRLTPRSRQQGLAVIVMLALLSIILLHMAANLRALHDLDRELQVTEQRQVRRLNAINQADAHSTNRVEHPSAATETK